MHNGGSVLLYVFVFLGTRVTGEFLGLWLLHAVSAPQANRFRHRVPAAL